VVLDYLALVVALVPPLVGCFSPCNLASVFHFRKDFHGKKGPNSHDFKAKKIQIAKFL
jgi:hypothetical protein